MSKISHSDLRRNFRELLATPMCVETASVFDPMSARIAADLGFEVGILGGSVASLQVLAAPDFALITLSEFVEQATRIGRVAQLPFIADADHGYGNALNVMRTVEELERAGVAALTIEDTLLPAQFARKSTDLISIEEGIGKVKAALEARVDPGLSIIARTNAGVLPTSAIIERTLAYEKAGADGICIVGIKDFEHLEQISEKLSVPLMLVTYGNPELNDSQRLASLGVRVVVAGHAAYFAAIKATYDSLRAQRQLTHSTSNLSATELTHTYTLPENYVAWAKEFMDVQE
ncbi:MULTISPECIES: isocitrate lyase/PEP mutase family protein [Pseudomonas]|jgi:carboxyvinyl-carboxyphosphonate phosphorylmutase|uniref:isocitrate lyase/PEP mutase family protein n=1 Tax=Pseudomonas TaxID=286 RepID=UPI000288FF06|nr:MULTISPECIES: oxaloacetate decarboxylase [Pseudomonas]AMB79689.1 oxaloacetate decarboxylase [Pseudomonas fragi]MCB1656266.1 oxaloacetate decarboxylase [Pseudomonadales bacterium]NBF15126.1 oxaloacetate decarboxylase [Pseudomonas sp. Fl4BN2]NNG61135.1 oxaloacetate decarboxylase [Pseudomonas sp. GC01]AUB75442.1 oxaloacetate decarboxylase [Pseudomonas sp. Lz4W]